MILSTGHTFPERAFAVVWKAGISCTSHTTWCLLALFPKVTKLLAVCTSGLYFWDVFCDL